MKIEIEEENGFYTAYLYENNTRYYSLIGKIEDIKYLPAMINVALQNLISHHAVDFHPEQHCSRCFIKIEEFKDKFPLLLQTDRYKNED